MVGLTRYFDVLLLATNASLIRLLGADMEERNSQGLTVLYTALELGRISIVKYIFEACPPSDAEGVYKQSRGPSLLSLAVHSKEPELVWVVLENKLATSDEIKQEWQMVTSAESTSKTMTPAEAEKHSDIISLLNTYGGLSPSATPSIQTINPNNLKRSGEMDGQKVADDAAPRPFQLPPAPSHAPGKGKVPRGDADVERGEASSDRFSSMPLHFLACVTPLALPWRWPSRTCHLVATSLTFFGFW